MNLENLSEKELQAIASKPDLFSPETISTAKAILSVIQDTQTSPEKDDRSWLYMQNTKVSVPCSAEEILSKIKSREITENAHVWCQGWNQWSPILHTDFRNAFSKSKPQNEKVAEKESDLRRVLIGCGTGILMLVALVVGGILLESLIDSRFWEYSNYSPPVAIDMFYVKNVGNYGAEIYFSLIDKDGYWTAADGKVFLWFYSEYGKYLGGETIEIKKSNFRSTHIGLGNFRRKAYLCDLGLIKYSTGHKGIGKRPFSVKIDFVTTTKQRLSRRKDDVYFD